MKSLISCSDDRNVIYLDNASTTKLDVLNDMMPYLTYEYGNAGTLYSLGLSAKAAVNRAREQVADFINAEPGQIIFTSGGTESNNAVFHHLSEMIPHHNDNFGVIISSIEHSSVIKSALASGAHVYYLDVDEYGRINPNDLERILSNHEEIKLLSVMYMNNEIGSRTMSTEDIQRVKQICIEREVLFHTDCVQAAGCVNIDVEEIGCDFLSLSSHKIHGPKGVGALYVKSPMAFSPLIHGGNAQEFGLRGGTENVPGIVGFASACKLAKNSMQTGKIHALKKAFWDKLLSKANEMGIAHLFHENAESVSNDGKVISLRIDGVDAETLVLLLGTKGVCVSAGSACESQQQEPSHVLTAIGLTPDEARNTIRISFSRMNEIYEVNEGADIIVDTAALLRLII